MWTFSLAMNIIKSLIVVDGCQQLMVGGEVKSYALVELRQVFCLKNGYSAGSYGSASSGCG